MGKLPWDWYVTFTFAGEVYPYLAVQYYTTWADQLAAEVGLVMTHARALEFQKRGVIHFHALIWNVGRYTSRKEWEGKWTALGRPSRAKDHRPCKDAGCLMCRDGPGWAKILPYDRTKGAAHYLPKYVAKDGEVDMLTFGTMRGRPDDRRLVGPQPV